MNKFQKFLESIKEANPTLVEGIAKAYTTQNVARLESLSEAGNKSMDKMKKLVDEHGYWSEPVKQYSAEMEQDESLSPDDRATVHSTHMNMY